MNDHLFSVGAVQKADIIHLSIRVRIRVRVCL